MTHRDWGSQGLKLKRSRAEGSAEKWVKVLVNTGCTAGLTIHFNVLLHPVTREWVITAISFSCDDTSLALAIDVCAGAAVGDLTLAVSLNLDLPGSRTAI